MISHSFFCFTKVYVLNIESKIQLSNVVLFKFECFIHTNLNTDFSLYFPVAWYIKLVCQLLITIHFCLSIPLGSIVESL